MLAVLIGAAFFSCVAFLGVVLSRAVCANIEPFDDGPPVGRAPVPWLILGAAILGALFMGRDASPFQLGLVSLVLLALVAAWCSDAICGIVPDIFTLGPLGAIVLFAVLERNWYLLLSVVIPFLPFAAAAAITRGRGMGWGDAKLTAFAGAALGVPLGIVALFIACIAAAIGYQVQGIRSGPIAFAPYIAAAIGITLPLAIGN